MTQAEQWLAAMLAFVVVMLVLRWAASLGKRRAHRRIVGW